MTIRHGLCLLAVALVSLPEVGSTAQPSDITVRIVDAKTGADLKKSAAILWCTVYRGRPRPKHPAGRPRARTPHLELRTPGSLSRTSLHRCGQPMLFAHADGYLSRKVAVASTSRTVVIKLTRQPRITGRVLKDDGTPYAGRPNIKLRVNDHVKATTTADVAGHFTLNAPVTGNVTLVAATDASNYVTRQLDLQAAMTYDTGTLRPREHTVYRIEGKVVDGQGKPITAATISVRPTKAGGRLAPTEDSYTTHNRGLFYRYVTKPGWYTLEIRAGMYPPATFRAFTLYREPCAGSTSTGLRVCRVGKRRRTPLTAKLAVPTISCATPTQNYNVYSYQVSRIGSGHGMGGGTSAPRGSRGHASLQFAWPGPGATVEIALDDYRAIIKGPNQPCVMKRKPASP